MMDVESAIALADELIFKSSGKSMSDLQRIVFRGAWQGKSFTEIHQDCRDRCGLDHLMRNVGPELWKLLSEATGTKVTKNHLQGAFSKLRGEFMSDRVYIDRFPVEQDCYAEILKPGALIRIRAAQDMGKTWLMEQVLSHARQNGSRTQVFNFELCDSTVLTDLNKFSQWFCASIAHAIGLPNRLSEYWFDIFGCNYNSTLYFENYLLQKIETPLVLALDKVDIVFEHSAIATDFCALLRGWNQRAMQGDEIGAIWKKLRLIIVHSTEVYSNLDINHSPIGGVGLIVKLPEFNRDQVQELFDRYQLDWNVDRLMNLVGGHPYLIQHAIKQRLSIDELLQSAATESGIYSDHLRRHWMQLQQRTDLAIAFKAVISSTEPVPLDPLQAFKLESMGLVHLQGNAAIPRCELYRLYFVDRL
ncbi:MULTISPECIES: AAA-like domain-containing protein [unclassified Leptolyngbya]|uniref:AAA-like domain-containing protein n=1 Tax=unclassified Leptolyngbya TaxID=2650499 RepID=UPI003D317270